MFISVIMCTRNRAEQLRRVLLTAVAMKKPDVEWEFLLIDNGSTDNTAEVVASVAGLLPIRHILEPEAGLSHARNRGVAEARGEYICWTDDDVMIDPNWLLAYAEAFRRYPEAAVFGGQIVPVLEGPAPRWFEQNYDKLASLMAKRDLGAKPIRLTKVGDHLPYGANFAVRTAEQKQWRYDPNLGVSPGQKRLGEEVAVMGGILDGGATGIWVPGAMVRHLIPKARLSLGYVGIYHRSAGETWAYLSSLESGGTAMGEPAPRGGRRLSGVPLWVWRKAAVHFCLYLATSVTRPSSQWLRHWIEFNHFRGAIEFWRRDNVAG
ncbi:glycosyltransferase [Cereibacter changlensis]|nr:glycosyltransferase [Cereibacter changlensis]